MKIDSHHHLWKYSEQEFGWINDEMQVLRRDFLPQDLSNEIAPVGIEGVISVQARQSLQETEFLLEAAEKHEFIRGIVGWAPLISPHVDRDIEKYSANPYLKSLRHVLQDEPDDDYMLRQDFDQGIRKLRDFDLVYDIVIYERHLPQARTLVDRHPNQVFVLDHMGKPRIRDGQMDPWRKHLQALAERPNVYCKVSGLTTEADWRTWTGEQLRPYFDVALAAFGPERLMFGSDWPVCLPSTTYQQWFGVVSDWLAELSAGEQERIWSGSAIEAYGL